MKKGLAIFTGVLFLAVLFTGNVWAYDFGTNITISDEDSSSSKTWYGDQEDQETEPGTLTDQSWDLEGMFLGENDAGNDILTIVGGYDFVNNQDWVSGDIYFDLGGSTFDNTSTAKFGTLGHDPNDDPNSPDSIYDQNSDGNVSVNYNWGYDLVFDVDWENFNVGDTTFNYDVYQLTSDSWNIGTYYNDFEESGAWRFDKTNGSATLLGSGVGSYLVGLSDDEAGLTGGSHNALSVDLTGYVDPTKFVAHFTMQCGNDNLMGDPGADPVPEPSTMILLGFGILGLVGFRKKFVK